MWFKRSKRETFEFSEVLKYDFIGTISLDKRFYNVYGSEGMIKLHNGEKMPAIIIRLTSDNSRDRYAVVGRINPVSNYWSDLTYDILRIIENEFFPRYQRK